jgi:antitoxin (DNA-binding transcriptional repressor) of toxin-antitoxin stability system
MRFQQTFTVALVSLIVQVAGAQQAPPRERIAGTVKSVAAGKLVLVTAKGDLAITTTPQTKVLLIQAASASDIKPGTYLGTANQNASGPNAGTATEVHLGDDGPNVNSPMNESGLTMTNGHVKSVTHTAAGEEMDIDYGQATTRHVVVTTDTAVTKMTDVGVAALKPGVGVTAMTTTGQDGKPVANFIQIDSAAAKPNP